MQKKAKPGKSVRTIKTEERIVLKESNILSLHAGLSF